MKKHELGPFVSPKRFCAALEIAGRTHEVEIETPDLNACPYSVWGAWGPMYTFELDPTKTVRVSYRRESPSTPEQTHELSLPRIRLDSPMLWERRQQQPFRLEFEDAERGLAFGLYLDRSGAPVELEVRQLRPESQIAASLKRGSKRRVDGPPAGSHSAIPRLEVRSVVTDLELRGSAHSA